MRELTESCNVGVCEALGRAVLDSRGVLSSLSLLPSQIQLSAKGVSRRNTPSSDLKIIFSIFAMWA